MRQPFLDDRIFLTLGMSILLAACASPSAQTPSPAPQTASTSLPDAQKTPAPPPPEPDAPEAPIETIDASPPSPFPESLALCNRTTISHAPPADADGLIRGYTATTLVGGVSIARAPVADGCFSSGFGMRPRLDGSSRLHKGVDLYHPDAVDIYAAGDGVVVEALYRDDYGNMIVIDHGDGVYTRYAHLERMEDWISPGATLGAGAVIATMGDTAGYSMPRHLHYEVLQGDYDTPARSFGLTPIDIFADLSETPASSG